jgi:hypothetical protein
MLWTKLSQTHQTLLSVIEPFWSTYQLYCSTDKKAVVEFESKTQSTSLYTMKNEHISIIQYSVFQDNQNVNNEADKTDDF